MSTTFVQRLEDSKFRNASSNTRKQNQNCHGRQREELSLDRHHCDPREHQEQKDHHLHHQQQSSSSQHRHHHQERHRHTKHNRHYHRHHRRHRHHRHHHHDGHHHHRQPRRHRHGHRHHHDHACSLATAASFAIAMAIATAVFLATSPAGFEFGWVQPKRSHHRPLQRDPQATECHRGQPNPKCSLPPRPPTPRTHLLTHSLSLAFPFSLHISTRIHIYTYTYTYIYILIIHLLICLVVHFYIFLFIYFYGDKRLPRRCESLLFNLCLTSGPATPSNQCHLFDTLHRSTSIKYFVYLFGVQRLKDVPFALSSFSSGVADAM